MSRYPQDEDGNIIDHVPGLEYYRDFLSCSEQDELLALIDANPWQEGVIARRQQFYGEVYYHTNFKSKVLQGCIDNKNENKDDNTNNKNENKSDSDEHTDNIKNASNANSSKNHGDKSGNSNNDIINGANNADAKKSGNGIPIDDSGMRKWLDKTMPLFEKEGLIESPTQILINEYKNNMGIASHFEDFDAFGPVILTVSLVSPVYMTLKKPSNQPTCIHGGESKTTNNNSKSKSNNINACDTYDDIIKVFLEPGSLLVMKGDARYKYRHGIGKYKWVNLPQPQPQLTSASASTAASTAESTSVAVATSPPPSETTTVPDATSTRIKRDDSYRRVSLTVRHLLSTRRKVGENEDESDTIKDPSVY